MLVTLVVFAYNHERFIARAIDSALRQSYQPLEIIISDDCSSDGTFDAAREAVEGYHGPHDVRVQRTPENLGLARHINLVCEQARGELIVVCAGDDRSVPHRVARLAEAYLASGRRAQVLYSNARIIDAEDRPAGTYLPPDFAPAHDAAAMSRELTGVLGSTQAWTRHLFTLFGPLQPEVVLEDTVIPFRAALVGEVAYLPEPLVLYRRHATNVFFRDPRAIPNTEVFFSHLRRLSGGTRATFLNRLADLDVAARLPDAAARNDLARLRAATCEALRETTTEHILLRAGNVERLRLLTGALLQGTPLRRIVRWILTLYVPRLYMRVQSLRAGGAAGHPAPPSSPT